MSTTPLGAVSISTQHTVRSRQYFPNKVFNVSLLPRNSWAYSFLKRLSHRSITEPASSEEIGGFRAVFAIVVKIKECRDLMGLPSEDLGRDEIRVLFQRVESIIAQQIWSLSTKKRYFAYFRKKVLQATRELDSPEAITTKSLRYSSKRASKPVPRRLISDFVNEEGSGIPPAPLGAIPHETLQELYKNAQRRVDLDLQAIVDACVKELEFWHQARKKIIELSKMTFSEEEAKIAFGFLAKESSKSKCHRERLKNKVSPIARVGLYAKFAQESGLGRKTAAPGVSFPYLKKALFDVLGTEERYLKGTKMWQILVTPDRMLSVELIAAFVLLLCHTGWNSHSLINMTLDRIKENGRTVDVLDGQVEIQGYKSRTDDDTPSVFLDRSNRYAIEALNLLLWNIRQLRSFGIVAADEKRIWFTYTSVECEFLTGQYIGFQNALDGLINKHRLPKFSLDQIRSQVLVATQLRFRNLDQTRRVAGHVNIATTGRYLEQEIFERLNSSLNLEFQRRLEATVHFRMSEIDDCVVSKFETERVDRELLVPIGDGASCIAPSRPPDVDYLEGAFCSGAMCHQEEGCENRRLIIDADRIEEVVRKRRYYAENWKRLLGDNAESFEKYHLDRMLFTFGMYDFIQNSIYGNILLKIQKNIETEESCIRT